jgi:hypothetical protein
VRDGVSGDRGERVRVGVEGGERVGVAGAVAESGVAVGVRGVGGGGYGGAGAGLCIREFSVRVGVCRNDGAEVRHYAETRWVKYELSSSSSNSS